MKPTIETILQNHLNRIHAEVIMTAYTVSSPGWSEQRTEPEFYRLCYTDRGQAWLHLQNEKHIVAPGTLYLLPAGAAQSFGTEGDVPFGRYWCHFRLDLGDIPVMHSLKLPPFVNVKDEEMVTSIFAKMIAAQQCDSFTKELRLKAALLELIAFYLDESHVQQKTVNDPSGEVMWNEVLAYIEANLHTNIHIDELAKFAFLHPNYFITTFKSITGCSPIQYVTNRRIETAKQLLTDTMLPIATIAKHVGMQNHYLSRLFKRDTGITPIQYRRLAKLGLGNRGDYNRTMSKEESV